MASAHSLESLNSSGLSIYPNPTTGNVRLSEVVEFEIFDALGQLIEEGYGGNVDLSSYAIGTYVLKTRKGTLRLVKQ